MFALVKLAGSEKIIGLNGSGKSPSALNSSILRKEGHTVVGVNSAHSITLPGAISAFEKLAEDFSVLGLAEACKPAIYYAENGVPVAPRVAFDWEKSSSTLSPNSRKHYLINGRVPRIGDIFKAPLQSDVLRKIAKQGAKGFYTGAVADDLISSLKNLGGMHTMEDLYNVSCDYVDFSSKRNAQPPEDKSRWGSSHHEVCIMYIYECGLIAYMVTLNCFCVAFH